MKIGVFINSQYSPGNAIGPEVDNIIEQVREAEKAGLSSVWFGQHLVTGPIQMLQMMPLLARIIPECGDMLIGSGVVLLAMQNPVRIAEEMATLDWLSDGKLIVGAGIGYRHEEFEVTGINIRTRGKRFEEALQIVRQCWQSDKIHFKGKHFSIGNQIPSLKPKQLNGPPIWIAGEVEPSIKRAALMGDAWLPLPVPNRATLIQLLDIFRSERAKLGLSQVKEQPLMREVYIGENNTSAFAECESPLYDKYKAYADWGQSESSSSNDEFSQDFRNFSNDRFLIGDTTSVADNIKRYRDELCIDHLICRVQWPGLSQEQVLSTIRRLGKCRAKL